MKVTTFKPLHRRIASQGRPQRRSALRVARSCNGSPAGEGPHGAKKFLYRFYIVVPGEGTFGPDSSCLLEQKSMVFFPQLDSLLAVFSTQICEIVGIITKYYKVDGYAIKHRIESINIQDLIITCRLLLGIFASWYDSHSKRLLLLDLVSIVLPHVFHKATIHAKCDHHVNLLYHHHY
jgi:hypothetical protein